MPREHRQHATRVMMLGLRGIPDVQGGIERHVEQLAPLMVAKGIDVEVVGRAPYMRGHALSSWRGVKLTRLMSPRSKSFETVIHTTLGVLRAAWIRPDILHLHAIGPSLLTPLARLLGLKVAVTHHGYDYNRDKWGAVARAILRYGESLGMRYSNLRIAVSRDIAAAMEQQYGAPTHFVPNGIPKVELATGSEALEPFGLSPNGYIMVAARLVPEKRQLDLIRAFAKLSSATGYKLAVVGGTEHTGAYELKVREEAEKTPGVVLTGFQGGETLAQLFAHAALFVLPSSHEGMPIALLEALSYGLPVLASDIVPNKELDLPASDYFPLGDIDALAAALERKLSDPMTSEAKKAQMARIQEKNSWNKVADETVRLYRTLLSEPSTVAAE